MTQAPSHGMSPKQRRLIAIISIAALLAGAMALVLGALRENIVFFYTPSEIPADVDGRSIRLGGLVKTGSVEIDGLKLVSLSRTEKRKLPSASTARCQVCFARARASLPKARSAAPA